jgi:DNA-binding transcriptional MerR regulator
MLRIGDLAKLAGTSVRTIHHYHAAGVLPEPPRDSSGHRQYGAADLIRLLRIRGLRDLGVPLREAGATDPDDLHSLLESLDRDLDEQQRLLDSRRRRIAELRRSVDPELPPEIAEYLSEFAEAGVDPVLLTREKESMLLMMALAPETAEKMVRIYAAMRNDPAAVEAITDVMRRLGELNEDAPDPAELQELAAELVRLHPELFVGDASGDGTTAQIFLDHMRSYTAGQRRLIELMNEHALT